MLAVALLSGCVSKGEHPAAPTLPEEGPAALPEPWRFAFELDEPAESGVWVLLAHFAEAAHCKVRLEASGFVQPDEAPAIVGAWRSEASASAGGLDTLRLARMPYRTEVELWEPFLAYGPTGFLWAASSPQRLAGEVACDGPFQPAARQAGATTIHLLAEGLGTPGAASSGAATFTAGEGEHLVSFLGPLGTTTLRHADGETTYHHPDVPQHTGVLRGPITVEMAGVGGGHTLFAQPRELASLPNESVLVPAPAPPGS